MRLRTKRLLSTGVLAATAFLLTAAPAAATPTSPDLVASVEEEPVTEETPVFDDVPSLGEPDLSEGDAIDALSANGGVMGWPVSVQIQVTGKKLRVDKIRAVEGWAGGRTTPGRYGHTEVYYQHKGKNHHIGNNANHGVSSALPGGIYETKPKKNYPDGSLMCARWWTKSGTSWSPGPSSCVEIHD